MKDLFIKSIYIQEVRHLKDVMIEIDAKEKKHLVITGKNGSGKTSVLLALKQNFSTTILNRRTNYNHYWDEELQSMKILTNISDEERDRWLKVLGGIILKIKGDQEHLLGRKFYSGDFVFAYFDSKRISKTNEPKGIQKVEIKERNKFDENLNNHFLQYIVNLKAEKSFANDDKDQKIVKKLDAWFDKFENNLRRLFDDSSLQLIFNRKEYNFYLSLSNGNKVTFNQLSDGYSAVLNIITELILRMENKSSGKYDMQGIVLIDEIETHLHIDLQKIVLPFLIDFFPNLQFIVTTHSPFVISSAENCVVYDLEQNIRLEDASGYSYDTLIESYFDSDKYSEVLKEKVDEYEKLSASKELSSNQIERLRELSIYFEKLPTLYSPELEVKLQQIKLR